MIKNLLSWLVSDLVLIYFIESGKKTAGSTPFNILPLTLARCRDFLELVAMLPSSPADLCHGWVRPRHSLGLSPLINVYSEEDVPLLMKNRLLWLKSPHKIFLAREEFSTSLIDECSEETAPSILITSSPRMKSHFQSRRDVRVVSYNTSELKAEVYRRCRREVIDLFIASGERDFSDKNISEESSESFCLEKSFLRETDVTSNLLCNANEIVMAQIRGKVPRFPSIKDSPPLQTEEAFKANVDLTMEISAERLVDITAAVIRKELVFTPRELMPGSSILGKSVNQFLSRLPCMSKAEKEKEYSSLKQIALSESAKISSRNEILLLVPTVNTACRRYLISELQKEVLSDDKDKLDYVIDQVLLGGRGIIFDRERLGSITEDMVRELADTRIAENVFLTNLVGLIASRRLSPVLKSTTVPSALFEEILALRAYVGQGYLSREDVSWFMTVGDRFRHVQAKLRLNVPKIYLNAIETIRPSNVTIVSDLPFELAQFDNDMAICQVFPTTRIPITPLSSMFSFYNRICQRGFVGERMSSLKDVLLLTSIHKEDKVFDEFQDFLSVCKNVGLNFSTKPVLSKDEFISALNSTTAEILIYFGHGSYNDNEDKGELLFRDDRLSFNELEKIARVPPIVFLIGCETASCSAFFGGLPSHLLARGAFAILAPIFPIPAEEAGVFLGRTLAFANEIVTRKQATDFSNLVFQARKLGWMRDNLMHLWRIGAISYPEIPYIMKEASDIATTLSLKKGYSISLRESAEVFKNALKTHDILDVWEKNRHNVVPYSLFFTLLGDAHNVLLGGD